MNRIELHDVSVTYPTHRVPSLKEWAIRAITKGHPRDHFHALKDISFVIGEGESVGIIGPNGAGKSTLLRVAAGIITPSRGYSVSRGTMAPLIELGTGFDGELSGIENIYFNGALLGRSKFAMGRKLPEIVEFAGLGEFINAPLRTYSTGMVGRLAFSIATSIDADIILLDEILSVGDASFQERCEERIKTFCGRGATVMLVSHNPLAIEALCERSIWIQNGTIHAMGPTAEVMASYAASIHPS